MHCGTSLSNFFSLNMSVWTVLGVFVLLCFACICFAVFALK